MRRRPENRVMDMHLIKVDNNLTNFDIVSGYGNVLYFCCRLDQPNGCEQLTMPAAGMGIRERRRMAVRFSW